MSLLTIEGFAVAVVPGTRLRYVEHGDKGRAFSGAMRSDVRALHRAGRIEGAYFSTDNDADALVAILNSPGPKLFGGTLIGDDAYFDVTNVDTAPVNADTLQISFDCAETDEAPSPLLFSFDADAPGSYTFTRASTGYYVTTGGALARAGGNRARIEFFDLDDDAIGRETPALLTSPQRINLVSSDNFDSGWTSVNTPVVTASISDPAGGTAAYRIADDNAGAVESKYLDIAFTGDAVKTVAFCVREATMATSGSQTLWIYDNTAGAGRLQFNITSWVGGKPQVTAVTGTLLGVRDVGDGYWLIFGRTTSVTAANTNRAIIEPASTSAATGSIDVYRVNAFNTTDFPSWSVLDASETLDNETFYGTFAHLQQPLSVYVKMIEGGSGIGTATNRGVVHIGGATSAADPRFSIYKSTAAGDGRYSALFDDGINVPSAAAINSGGAVLGDVVELVAQLDYNEDATADVRIYESINDAAALSGTAVGVALNTDRAWNLTPARIYLGSRAGDTERGFNPIISVRVVQGIRTMAEMRDWARARLNPRISTDVIAPLSVSRSVSAGATSSVSVAVTVV